MTTSARLQAFRLLLTAALVAIFAGLDQTAHGTRPPDDWIKQHWRHPLAPQRKPPAGFSPLEASLDPKACGTCHQAQYAGWSRSFHAKAFSPGLAGQLPGFGRTDQLDCLRCHAPLAEQALWTPDGKRRNPAFDPKLQAKGVSCAACHVREWQRYGPPRGLDSLPVGSVHGGAVLRREFEDSRFCASCHQFDGTGLSLNGKPLENTVAEWQASPFARKGVSCQQCHMPNRRHEWRGIHDPAMVRQALSVDFQPTGSALVVRLTNVGAGHAFPTYVTPRVTFRAVARDHAGAMVAGSERLHVIARQIDLVANPPKELSDTRLLPGRSATLTVPLGPRTASVTATVDVAPDHFYEGVYRGLLGQPGFAGSRAQIGQAHAESRTSPFRAVEQVWRRP